MPDGPIARPEGVSVRTGLDRGGTVGGMDEPVVLRGDAGGVATLTLNRPKARNALSVELMAALQEQLGSIDRDPAVKVVVLAGNGPAFSAGHDLREIQAHPDPAFRQALFEQCSALMLTIVGLRQPVIAKVTAWPRRPGASSWRRATWRWRRRRPASPRPG